MKKHTALLFLFLTMLLIKSMAQSYAYWQQQVNYSLHVSLNDKDKTLDGFEKLIYTNHSPDTLHYIWFHLWPNAYKNDKTAFSEQMLRNRDTRFYFSDDKEQGYINQLDFKVNSVAAILQPDSINIDVAKLLLPTPLAPGDSVKIETPFHVKLPYNFSRGGYVGQTFQATQWYPKPAVYDRKGWHQMPYLDQGEFFSEYGNFDVHITVPENYIVAASGNMQNTEELEKIKALVDVPVTQQPNYRLYQKLNGMYETRQERKKKDIWAKKPKEIAVEDLMPPTSSKTKTLDFVLNNAHDFAWFANKLFLVQHDTVKLATHNVHVFTYFHPSKIDTWQPSIGYVKDAVRFYSEKVGEYPYNVATAVAGSSTNTGSMEYPTITLVTNPRGGESLDAVIAHEVGHNWFYGILGSNEREHPWMDEGINTYYQERYEMQKYGYREQYKGLRLPKILEKKADADQTNLILRIYEKAGKVQPIDLTSEAYTIQNYGQIVYDKTAIWMRKLHADMGAIEFDSAMSTYYNQWKFKHPYPEDFKQVIVKSEGKETGKSESTDSLFKKLNTTETLFPKEKKTLKPAFLFSLKETNKYNYISFLPIAGFNNYDKLMIGGMVHNYQLPLNNFNFLVAPMYATETKKLTGAARLSYSIFKPRYWLETSVSGETFTKDYFPNYIGSKYLPITKLYQSVQRFVPSVKLVLYDKDPRSARKWTFQLRSFLLREDYPVVKLDSTANDTFAIATNNKVNTTLMQLRVTLQNDRVLYPYHYNLTIDQGTDFLRAGFTGNYFFNYEGNNTKGVNARLFAGKFFYLKSKTPQLQAANGRYYFTMSGAPGANDFTYSNYFIGRNEVMNNPDRSGWMSQQIMERDGFLKVRLPYSGGMDQTDNWLAALNLTADLPIGIPIKGFVDIGTSDKGWGDKATSSSFLYDAGLQLSLFKYLNVYVPIFYSSVYKDAYQSYFAKNKFLHTISFSIDIQKIKIPNRILPL